MIHVTTNEPRKHCAHFCDQFIGIDGAVRYDYCRAVKVSVSIEETCRTCILKRKHQIEPAAAGRKPTPQEVRS